MVTPSMPVSAAPFCAPLLSASKNTVPDTATASTSPKLLLMEALPAGSTTALIALGTLATGVAVPTTVPSMVPAAVMPLIVATPLNTGCAACWVTV